MTTKPAEKKETGGNPIENDIMQSVVEIRKRPYNPNATQTDIFEGRVDKNLDINIGSEVPVSFLYEHYM